MSHVVTTKVTVKNLAALERAANKLGLELRLGQQSYKWYGRHMADFPLPDGFKKEDLGKCQHALSVIGNPSAYEVGLVEQADGSYVLIYDFWSGGYGLMDKIGKDAKTLRDEYALSAAELAAEQNGWIYERNAEGLKIFAPGGEVVVTADGSIDAIGFQGGSCTPIVDALSAALGKEQSRLSKPELNQVQLDAHVSGE